MFVDPTGHYYADYSNPGSAPVHYESPTSFVVIGGPNGNNDWNYSGGGGEVDGNDSGGDGNNDIFPDNPTDEQTVEHDGETYMWNEDAGVWMIARYWQYKDHKSLRGWDWITDLDAYITEHFGDEGNIDETENTEGQVADGDDNIGDDDGDNTGDEPGDELPGKDENKVFITTIPTENRGLFFIPDKENPEKVDIPNNGLPYCHKRAWNAAIDRGVNPGIIEAPSWVSYKKYRKMLVTMTRDPLPKTAGYLFMNYPGNDVNPFHVVYYEYEGGNEAEIWWTNGINQIENEPYTVNSKKYRGSTEFWFAPLTWLK